jgi:hypothetical protein
MGLNNCELHVSVKKGGKPDSKSGKICFREVCRMRPMKATQQRNFVANIEVVVDFFCIILSLHHQRKTRTHFCGESCL